MYWHVKSVNIRKHRLARVPPNVVFWMRLSQNSGNSSPTTYEGIGTLSSRDSPKKRQQQRYSGIANSKSNNRITK